MIAIRISYRYDTLKAKDDATRRINVRTQTEMREIVRILQSSYLIEKSSIKAEQVETTGALETVTDLKL